MSRSVETTPPLSHDIVRHAIPFHSLDEVDDIEGLRSYFKRFAALRRQFSPNAVDQFYLDYKLVGVPVQVLYRKGKIILALTKHTGYTGEDITTCVANLPNVPERIRTSQNVYIRGEIVVHRADFYAVNQQREMQGELPFKTMKQCVEDTLRSGDLQLLRKRTLRFYGWELFLGGQDELTQTEQIKVLQNFGFNTPRGQLCTTVEEMMSFVNETARIRNTLPYIIDGVVVKQNDPEYRAAIGVKKGIEMAKCVWRFSDAGMSVTVDRLEWQVDRSGRLVPIARFPAVNLNGVMVDQVSLINARWVSTHHLGINSKLVIDQSGDNAPRVQEILTTTKTVKYALPDKCPCCGSELLKAGNDLFCTNFECPDLLEASLVYLVTTILKYTELTPEQIHQLVASKTVTKLIDVFLPMETKTDAVSQEVLDQLVRRVRDINLLELIMLLGVPNMGKAVASKLASETCSVGAFIKFLNDEKELNFMQFNSLVKDSLRAWIADPHRLAFLKEVKKLHLPYCG